MKQKTKQELAQYSHINTSSLLRLTVPQHLQYQSYSFQWRTQQQTKDKQPNDISNLFKRENNFNQSYQGHYQCTPLDYGKIIVGNVLLQQGRLNKVILQQKFGPVDKQKNLEVCQISSQKQMVRIEINKYKILFGTIKITSCPFVAKNSFKLDIALAAENFEFLIRMEPKIKIPPKVSFFKFYPKQENCLGLSIFHQHKQFMQKLKQIKSQAQYGYYLKVYFKNRKYRDAFLFQLMEYFGIANPQMKVVKCEEPYQFNIIPEKSVQNSSVSADTKRNQKQKQEKKKDIDDQIYKLLYESQQAAEDERRISFALQDAQNLFADLKKSDIIGGGNDSFNKYQSQIQKNKKINWNLSNITQKNDLKEQQNKILKKQATNVQVLKNNHIWTRNNSGNTLRRSDKQMQLRGTITQLTNQIDSLLKQNRKLSRQNKKLRDEVMKLRIKDAKGYIGKKNHQGKSLHVLQKVSSPRQLSSRSITPPNKVIRHDNNIVRLFEAKKQTSISKLIQSRVTQREKTITIESPNSAGYSQQIGSNYERKNGNQNFASFSTMANHLFLKDQATICSKSSNKYNYFVTKNKDKNSMMLSTATKNTKNPNQLSFDKQQVPMTPSFNNQHINSIEKHHNLDIKSYQSSCFFRQYIKQ